MENWRRTVENKAFYGEFFGRSWYFCIFKKRQKNISQVFECLRKVHFSEIRQAIQTLRCLEDDKSVRNICLFNCRVSRRRNFVSVTPPFLFSLSSGGKFKRVLREENKDTEACYYWMMWERRLIGHVFLLVSGGKAYFCARKRRMHQWQTNPVIDWLILQSRFFCR